jgi:predicted secreted protein
VSATASELQALGTMESVIAQLQSATERDDVITRLVAAIEQDRAELLAAVIGAQGTGRVPRRVRRTAGG